MASTVARVAESQPIRAARATVGSFGRLQLTDHAAALTYYAMLSVFPALIVFFALLGIFGDEGTADSILNVINELAPGSAAETFESATRDLVVADKGASLALAAGLAGALYAASGYIGAFSRAANDIFEATESRPFWRTVPRRVVITLFLMTMLGLAVLALVLTGPLAEAVGDEIGVGDTAQSAFGVAKWPFLAAVVSLLFAVLQHEGPNVEHRSFLALLPGSFLAMVIWLAASAGFSVYVANFGSYASTYGSIAGVVVFLIWLWLSNLALLIGATFNAELARARELVTEGEAMTCDEPGQRPPSATAI